MRKRSWPRLLSVVLAGALAECALAADDKEEERCSARIEVELEPSVPNPRDPAFLSGLLASPLYQLQWIEGDDSRAVYQLTGPVTDHNCEQEIEQIRRSASLLELRVLPD